MAGAVYFGMMALDPVRVTEAFERPAKPADAYIFGFFSLFCTAITIGSVYILAKESKHWNLRHLTAERVVSGMFLLAIAVGIIGVWLLHGEGGGAIPASAIVLALAVGLFLLALVVGLLVVGFQALSQRPRKLGSARILAKYAVDDKLQRIEGHPCPADDGMTAVVEVEFLTGETGVFRASPDAYDLAKVGCIGVVFGAGRHLKAFHAEPRTR